MNAHAILSAQGWRGHGHSLHKTNDGIGLSKPLLISRKDNTKGLGTAQHFNADQWWLTAFDEQLKGLETSKKGGLKQTVTKGKLNTIQAGALGKYSVYTSFVSGGFLDGTVDLLKKQWEGSTSESTSEDDESDKDAKSKDKKKGKRTETKEERRARKEAKRNRREEKATRRAEKELRRAARQARRERKKAKANGNMTSSSDSSDATSEEKRRRRAKKEEKRKKQKLEEKAAKS